MSGLQASPQTSNLLLKTLKELILKRGLLSHYDFILKYVRKKKIKHWIGIKHSVFSSNNVVVGFRKACIFRKVTSFITRGVLLVSDNSKNFEYFHSIHSE